MGNFGTRPVEEDIIIKCPLEKLIKDFFKDYVIVWHDPNSSSEENQDHKVQLEEFCKVLTFTEWEKAREEIHGMKAVCHVITSGTNGERLVKEICEQENVCNIYIFCRNKEYHSTWAKNYPKITCVESRIETVLNRIQQSLRKWWQQEDSLRVNLPAFAPIFNDWDKSEMNYLHLYLRIIPNFKNREQAKNDFVSLAKRIYSQEGELKLITDFEQNYNRYNKEQALKWYTRDSFLFKVLNKSLRIATSDSIQYCRLLLKDIERAIKEQYQTESKNFNGLLYRGTYLSEEEWSKLKENTDQEIEMHGFLSVSKKERVALNFMKTDSSKKVFITIIVPKGPNEEEQGFTEMEEFSQFAGEKEILFNVRSRFTVLETEEKYSQKLPYRHLVLLYGAQGFRKFLAEQNPIREISIARTPNISCTHCKGKIFEMAEKIGFVSITDRKKEVYCKKCLNYDASPFLSLSIMDKVEKKIKTKISGCLLRNQRQIPFYGYKCCNCQAKRQKSYFICTDCGVKEKKWCEDCFHNALDCIEAGHNILLETSPFSFWCEKMSANESHHLKFQNNLVKTGDDRFQQAEMYFESHEYEKAIEYYSFYIEKNKANPKDSNLTTSFNRLRNAYQEHGDSKKALEYFLTSQDTNKSISRDRFLLEATSDHNLGKISEEQGNYKEAFRYIFISLVSNIAVNGPTHPSVAHCCSSLASVYEKLEEYNEALGYYLKSLDTIKSFYGDKHPEAAATYCNIGAVLLSQGKLSEALCSLFKTLEIEKLTYGDKHPLVAATYCNIGTVFSFGGSPKALEYLEKALEIEKSIFGDNHPLVASTYHNIGSAYTNQKEDEKALEYYFKALNIYKSVYGNNHPLVATSYNNIGKVCYNQGEGKKALQHFLESLDIYKSVYGDNHPFIATSYNNIACTYAKQGESKNALEYFLKCLDVGETLRGAHLVAEASCNLGSFYSSQGDEKALEYFQKCLEIKKSVSGYHHPSAAASGSNLEDVSEKQEENKNEDEVEYSENHDEDKNDDNVKYAYKSFIIFKSFYGDNHKAPKSIHNKILALQLLDQSVKQ